MTSGISSTVAPGTTVGPRSVRMGELTRLESSVEGEEPRREQSVGNERGEVEGPEDSVVTVTAAAAAVLLEVEPSSTLARWTGGGGCDGTTASEGAREDDDKEEEDATNVGRGGVGWTVAHTVVRAASTVGERNMTERSPDNLTDCGGKAEDDSCGDGDAMEGKTFEATVLIVLVDTHAEGDGADVKRAGGCKEDAKEAPNTGVSGCCEVDAQALTEDG